MYISRQLSTLFARLDISGNNVTPPNKKTVITEDNQELPLNFRMWLDALFNGSSVLVHGLGTKRLILESFRQSQLSNSFVLVVNGLFVGLDIEDMLKSIAVEVLRIKQFPKACDTYHLLADEFNKRKNLHLYIIVHNIDGPALKEGTKAHKLIEKLALNIRNVHLVASMDHANATSCKFNIRDYYIDAISYIIFLMTW